MRNVRAIIFHRVSCRGRFCVSEKEGVRFGKKDPMFFKTWEVRVPMPAGAFFFAAKIAQRGFYKANIVFFANK